MMKLLLIIAIHIITWSWFTAVMFLSKKDGWFAELSMFLLFLYIAYLLANRYISQKPIAFLLTLGNTAVFFFFQQLYMLITTLL